MARLDKVTFVYSRKINLGDYNSIELSMMPTVHLDPHDKPEEVTKDVWEMCRNNIRHAAQPIVEQYQVGGKHGITKEELFLGLPQEWEEERRY